MAASTFFDNSGKPIFIQLAERLMEQIATGRLSTDQRLLSVREYASEAEVNANTVMRSYEMLDRLGIIYNKRGIGFFVSNDADNRIRSYFSEEFFNKELPRIFSRMNSLGVTPQQLMNLYSQYINSSK